MKKQRNKFSQRACPKCRSTRDVIEGNCFGGTELFCTRCYAYFKEKTIPEQPPAPPKANQQFEAILERAKKADKHKDVRMNRHISTAENKFSNLTCPKCGTINLYTQYINEDNGTRESKMVCGNCGLDYTLSATAKRMLYSQNPIEELISDFGTPGSGIKFDDGKFEWSLLPFKALESVVAVMMYGARKYSPDNWKKVQNPIKRYTDAMLRHVISYCRGEKIDSESGKSHLAHAVCCALFIIYFEVTGEGK